MQIDRIFVDLSNLVIDENIANINSNKYKAVTDIVVEMTGVKEEKITVYG